MTAEEILAMPMCPVVWVNNKPEEDRAIHCSKDCAWYDEFAQRCAVLTIAKEMRKAVTRK